jgi:hypothetical protein
MGSLQHASKVASFDLGESLSGWALVISEPGQETGKFGLVPDELQQPLVQVSPLGARRVLLVVAPARSLRDLPEKWVPTWIDVLDAHAQGLDALLSRPLEEPPEAAADTPETGAISMPPAARN